jgi:hypothetical protein
MTINREKELQAFNVAINKALNKVIEERDGDQDQSNAIMAYALSIKSQRYGRQTLSTRQGGDQLLQSFIRKTGVHPAKRIPANFRPVLGSTP